MIKQQTIFIIIVLTFFSCESNIQTTCDNQDVDTIVKFKYKTIKDKNCYFISLVELPILYVGVPNTLQYPENLRDSITIYIQDGTVKLFKNTNHCKIIPNKVGNKQIVLSKKITESDSIVLLTKMFRVRKLPNPTINISRREKMTKKSLLSIDKLQSYVENLLFEIRCNVKSFSIILYTDSKEVVAKSNGAYFSQEQIKLIAKVKNQHIIFSDIIVELPYGEVRKIPDFVIEII